MVFKGVSMYMDKLYRKFPPPTCLLQCFRGVSNYWGTLPEKRRRKISVVVLTLAIFGFLLEAGSVIFYRDFWEWQTTSRFLNLHNDANVSSSSADHVCDAFPSYLLSRVQVVLKVGSSEPPERIETQLSTVTRCISNLLIFSDQEAEINGHHIYDILATLPESFWGNTSDSQAYDTVRHGGSIGSSEGWLLDRFKFLPMVERTYELNPTAKWFVFLESDTYFVWDNLFRLLDQYDPATPLYFGSPTGGKGWTHFAYGGTGFVISSAAVQKLVARKVGGHGEYSQPPLNQQYEGLIKEDCCGDSILGWALHKRGVDLSGLWPMFNPHAVNRIPYNEVHWCQPVISMHKLSLEDMVGLSEWERERGQKTPLLYADLFEYTEMGTFDSKSEWDNGDWGGWQEPPTSPGHQSLEDCRTACYEHPKCLSYTYDSSGHCTFVPAMRLGAKKPDTDGVLFTAGWDLEKMKEWRATHVCRKPQWMKPSTRRIF